MFVDKAIAFPCEAPFISSSQEYIPGETRNIRLGLKDLTVTKLFNYNQKSHVAFGQSKLSLGRLGNNWLGY
jgi:hypothetical protein